MNCADLFKNLPDYLDADMRQELCRELEAHVQTCPDCRKHVRTMQATVGLVQSLCSSKAHEEWLACLKKRILGVQHPPTSD